MASLEQRNGTYRIVFRFGGQKFSRSLKTSDIKAAESSLARLEDNLHRLEVGTLTIEDGDDVAAFLLSSGAINQRRQIKKSPNFGQFLDQYFASIPEDSIEQTTRSMLTTHIKHLKRIVGVRTRLTGIGLEKLQSYVNTRSKEAGRRGRRISAVTIGKELTTLTTAWSWGIDSEIVVSVLPKKSRLRFPKQDEKPPFKTWNEIEQVIRRAGLNDAESREYWDCVYLNRDEIADLLSDVEAFEVPPFVLPMFAVAAYTGARRSELLRSQIEDIDLEHGHMVIREKKRLKGMRSTRSVPISPGLAKILTDWFNGHPGGRMTFCHQRQPLSRDQAHDYFVRTLAGSKWDVLRGWHVLRHSFISVCASRNVDQRMIDDWVGHQTDAMRRRYRHLFPTLQRDALTKVFE